jgi:hypothetical protein
MPPGDMCPCRAARRMAESGGQEGFLAISATERGLRPQVMMCGCALQLGLESAPQWHRTVATVPAVVTVLARCSLEHCSVLL